MTGYWHSGRRQTARVGTPIPLHLLRIGMRIHLRGMDFGCVWEVTNILSPDSKGEVYIWAKTTGDGALLPRPVKASRAYYIRADEPRK